MCITVGRGGRSFGETMDILLIILVILLLTGWVGGIAIGYTLGGLVHLLVVVALIIVIVRLARGQSIT